jgi:teichoic acid transport system permease protein
VNLRLEASGGGRAYSDVVHVFEPHEPALPPVRPYLRDLAQRGAFIRELAVSGIRGQRASTFLGELWALLEPLFQAAIYYFLFTVIRGRGGSANSTEWLLAIISSVFFFNYTRIAITDGGRAILRNKGLVLNAIFPRALLPIAEVYKGFLSTLPALAVYVVIHVAFGGPVTAAVFLLPLLLTIHTVMNLGLAFLFATATVLVKDMVMLQNYILRILMFTTPVVYPVSFLPSEIRSVLVINPLFQLFSAYQSVISGNMPTAGMLVQSLIWCLVVFTIGARTFLRHERSFALHI